MNQDCNCIRFSFLYLFGTIVRGKSMIMSQNDTKMVRKNKENGRLYCNNFKI